MNRFFRPVIALISIVPVFLMLGCPSPDRGGTDDGEPGPDGVASRLGRYIFEAPVAFSETASIDLPRLVRTRNGTVHLVYLVTEGMSGRVWQSRIENGAFRNPGLLSSVEGTKQGGGFLAETSANELVGYYINVGATGGQLYYKSTANNGRSWSMERRWNDRGEARWPCVMGTDGDTVAYFFVRHRDDWELVSNRNFSEDEPSVDYAQGTPYNLQGLTDGELGVWLAYYVRHQHSDGGRIAFLTSGDGGRSFDRRYLFDDRVIPNIFNFFRMERSRPGEDEFIHLIFTEESPELTTVYYTRSDDGGESFGTPLAMIQSVRPLTRAPLLLTNGNYIVVMTADTEDEGPALRYRFSENGGESFDEPVVATRQVSAPETLTGILGRDGELMLVWDDLAGSTGQGEQLYSLKGILRGG